MKAVSSFFLASLIFTTSASAEVGQKIGQHDLLRGIPGLGGKNSAPLSDRPIDASEMDQWESTECLSDGTCIYTHKVTGEQRLRNSKKTELTEAEKVKLAETDVKTKAELFDKVELAQKAGKKVLILQVGNLESCNPCKALSKKVTEEILPKESTAFTLDINFNNLKDQELKDWLKKNELPDSFPYPYLFVINLDGKKKRAFTTLQRLPSPHNTVPSIEKAVGVLKEMQKQDALAGATASEKKDPALTNGKS